jgi:hypothetical protein
MHSAGPTPMLFYLFKGNTKMKLIVGSKKETENSHTVFSISHLLIAVLINLILARDRATQSPTKEQVGY